MTEEQARYEEILRQRAEQSKENLESKLAQAVRGREETNRRDISQNARRLLQEMYKRSQHQNYDEVRYRASLGEDGDRATPVKYIPDGMGNMVAVPAGGGEPLPTGLEDKPWERG